MLINYYNYPGLSIYREKKPGIFSITLHRLDLISITLIKHSWVPQYNYNTNMKNSKTTTKPVASHVILQLPDLFNTSRQSPYSKSLDRFKELLEKQFNQDNKFQDINQFKKVFQQVVLLKCDSFKISLLVLIMCFRRAAFIEDLKIFQKGQEWKGSRKSSINLLKLMLDKSSYNPNGNPISDMKDIIGKLLKDSKICQEAVSNCLSEDDAKQLFYQLMMSPDRPENNNKNFQRLIINKIKKSYVGKKSQQIIQKLKQEQCDFIMSDVPRYCYAYLYPRDEKEGVVGSWIVCVMAYRMEKLIQPISQADLESQCFIRTPGQEGQSTFRKICEQAEAKQKSEESINISTEDDNPQTKLTSKSSQSMIFNGKQPPVRKSNKIKPNDAKQPESPSTIPAKNNFGAIFSKYVIPATLGVLYVLNAHTLNEEFGKLMSQLFLCS